MPKPKIGKKLPVMKTEEFERHLKKNGFEPDGDKHTHIQYINEKGIKITVIKGRKDIHPNLLKIIIKEMATKMKITEQEVIEKLFDIKDKKRS